MDKWTVQDTIDDMAAWLTSNRVSGEWSPIVGRVEEWHDELVKATTDSTAG